MNELLPRRERVDALRKACAIAHGMGAGMSEAEMITHILEHGLPPRVERELTLEARLAEGAGTTPPHSPS